MSFRLILFPIFLLANLLAFMALSRGAAQWFAPEKQRRAVRWMGFIIVLLNLPLLVFFFPLADSKLQRISPWLLRLFFYPSAAWIVTLIAVLLIAVIAAPTALVWAWAKALAGWMRGQRSAATAENHGVSRRSVLAGGPGLVIGGIYGLAAYGVSSNMNEIDVSKEHSIPIPHLPRSLDGMTVVQFSDLHVGPYIRERELRHIVSLTNQLRPDLVVITGDVLDRHITSLPDAVNGLSGIRAPLGVYSVLGNHDYYADRYSYSGRYRGGIRIANGLESIGIHTLRNEVVHVGSGQDRLALLGLDWLTTSPTDRSFYSYKPAATRRQLQRMLEQLEPENPSILLAHHPDTFQDVPSGIGLTLSGHTHGGGQVILGHVDKVPIGIATLRFKYLSGLYQKNGSSLYVNRGIGYLGIPIRINCPPEISRFKLVRPTIV